MLQTSARLLRLLSLLQARGFWSGGELARRLEITERTVRRDVDRLRELGYPINAASGVAGGYRLGAGASLPPLLLDDDEALAVALGLRTAAAGTVSGMAEAALRALAKLEQVLPPRLTRRVKALHGSTVSLQMGGPAVDAATLSTLAAASRDREIVRLDYGDRRGESSDRLVEPHGLVHSSMRWYLVAWDQRREDWRTFRVDRVRACQQSGRRFVARAVPGGDLGKFVAVNVGVNAYPSKIRVELHVPFEDMRQRISPLIGTLEPHAARADRCVLECGGSSLSSAGLYIAMLGVEFRVLEPSELSYHLRDAAERMLRAAGPEKRVRSARNTSERAASR